MRPFFGIAQLHYQAEGGSCIFRCRVRQDQADWPAGFASRVGLVSQSANLPDELAKRVRKAGLPELLAAIGPRLRRRPLDNRLF